MKPPEVAAIMVHVADPAAGLRWYERAFPVARRAMSTMDAFEFLRIGRVQLEIVQADAKVGSGPHGTVVYWQVEDFTETLAHFQQLGATLYRGPRRIEEDLMMCQVQDPWGNCIGLRGPAGSREPSPSADQSIPQSAPQTGE